MENKITNKFTNEETLCIINLFTSDEFQTKFHTSKRKHTHIWDEIAQDFNKSNVPRTGKQISDRFKNIKKKYVDIKRSLCSGDETPSWPFWEVMNKFFGQTPYVEPSALADSMALEDEYGSVEVLLSEGSFEQSMNSILNGDQQDISESPGSSTAASISTGGGRRGKKRKPDEAILNILREQNERDEEYMARAEERDERMLGLLERLVNQVTDHE